MVNNEQRNDRIGGLAGLGAGILAGAQVGTVLLPRLSREALHNRLTAFRETYDRGISWAWFVAVPAALTLLVSSKPIADAIAFGSMRENHGVALLSAAIASLGLALVGATMYEFAKQACYARHDVVPPLVGCAVMVTRPWWLVQHFVKNRDGGDYVGAVAARQKSEGLPILGYGLLYSPILVIDGALILFAGIFGWAMEPSAEPPTAGEH